MRDEGPRRLLGAQDLRTWKLPSGQLLGVVLQGDWLKHHQVEASGRPDEGLLLRPRTAGMQKCYRPREVGWDKTAGRGCRLSLVHGVLPREDAEITGSSTLEGGHPYPLQGVRRLYILQYHTLMPVPGARHRPFSLRVSTLPEVVRVRDPLESATGSLVPFLSRSGFRR